jgi:DNA-binding PadR family transcriptional regulator
MDEQNTEGRRHEHPHRHEGRRRSRAERFGAMQGFPGARGFDLEHDEAEFAGPGFGRMGFRGGPGGHGIPGPHGPGEFGPWTRGRRGSRAKRGNARAAALALLAEEPMNGYQIIQQISERSGGLWQPSPGSVYPALAQLEDEGLIAQQGAEGARRAYVLTDEGRAYIAAHPDEVHEPWSAMAGGAASAAADMRTLVHQVHLAAIQVISAGTDDQVNQARKVLAQTRRALYRILAEDEPAEPAESAGGEPGTGPVADAEPAS